MPNRYPTRPSFRSFLCLGLLAAISAGCTDRTAGDGTSGNPSMPRPNPYAKVVTPSERLRLTNIYCGACHNVGTRDHDQLLAPPFVAIRWRYRMSFPDRESFIARIIDFTHDPVPEKTLMRGPVQRFGVMPPMPHVPEDELREIAIHIFEGEIETPVWWESHRETMRGQRGPNRYGSGPEGKTPPPPPQ